jgi:hypothetical protein
MINYENKLMEFEAFLKDIVSKYPPIGGMVMTKNGIEYNTDHLSYDFMTTSSKKIDELIADEPFNHLLKARLESLQILYHKRLMEQAR